MDHVELAEKTRSEALEIARQTIAKRTANAIKIITDIISSDVELTAESASVDRLRLDAAKHTLKLAGLEIERSEIDVKNVTISIEQAKKILENSEL